MTTWRGIDPGDSSLLDRLLRGFVARKFGRECAYPELAGKAIAAAILETQSSTRETNR